VIARLKESGLKIGLVSNSGRGLVDKILAALGLEKTLFDAVVTGTDVEPKPSHQPFLLAINKLQCDKVSTVYVGDRDEAEIRPAHEVGLRTILLSRNAEEKRDAKWADVVIGDIADLEKTIFNMTQPSVSS
jgi:FMN phosphatase YigB (HAD superfamily)